MTACTVINHRIIQFVYNIYIYIAIFCPLIYNLAIYTPSYISFTNIFSHPAPLLHSSSLIFSPFFIIHLPLPLYSNHFPTLNYSLSLYIYISYTLFLFFPPLSFQNITFLSFFFPITFYLSLINFLTKMD